MKSKAIVWTALGLLAISTLVAPYKFEGHIGIVYPVRAGGTIHRPIWGGAPKAGALEVLPTDPNGDTEMVFLSNVALDSTQLGLWWFGIALCAMCGPAPHPTRFRS